MRVANHRNIIGPDGSYTLYHGELTQEILGWLEASEQGLDQD